MAEEKIGADATFDAASQTYSVTVPSDFNPGTYELFGRMTHTDTSTLDTVHRDMTFREPTDPGDPGGGTFYANWLTPDNSITSGDQFQFTVDAQNSDVTDPVVRGELVQVGSFGFRKVGDFVPSFGWNFFLPLSDWENGTYTFTADFFTQKGRKVTTAVLTMVIAKTVSNQRLNVLKALGYGGEDFWVGEFEGRVGRRVHWRLRWNNRPGPKDSSGWWTNGFFTTFSDSVTWANAMPDDVDVIVTIAGIPTNVKDFTAGANGDFDDQWQRVGRTLNSLVRPQKYWLRLFHEHNGAWYDWTTKAYNSISRQYEWSAARSTGFKNYWRKIWNAIHSQMGTKRIKFDYNTSGGEAQSASEQTIVKNDNPGALGSGWEHVVDCISLDMYANWGVNSYAAARQRLDFYRDYARAQNKRVGLHEGSPVCWKYTSGENKGFDSGVNIAVITAVYDWALECVGILLPNGLQFLTCVMLFERDPRPEGWFALILGQVGARLGTRIAGKEVAEHSLRLLYPAEHKRNWHNGDYAVTSQADGAYVFQSTTNASTFTYRTTASPVPAGYKVYYTPPGVPGGLSATAADFGQRAPQNRLPARYSCWDRVGGTRIRSAQSNFPTEADEFMDIWGGPLPIAS